MPLALTFQVKGLRDLQGRFARMNDAVVQQRQDALLTQVAKEAKEALVDAAPRGAGKGPLASYFAFAQSETITSGRIGSLYGLDVRMSQLCPFVAGTPNTTTNVVLQEEAIMFASRPFPPVPAGAGVLTATSVDEPSGLSVRLSMQWDVNNISTRCNLDVLWGAVALRPTVGVIVTT